ncbi:MAG: hypothetical protein HY815_31800 [Candidatus Riflebacteria bacterium]|nr:hypothetical protein [Candidatus Riflebacteria bacterium]
MALLTLILLLITSPGCGGGGRGGGDAGGSATPVEVVTRSRVTLTDLASSLAAGKIDQAVLHTEEGLSAQYRKDWSGWPPQLRVEFARALSAGESVKVSPRSVTFKTVVGTGSDRSTVFFRMVQTDKGWKYSK